MSCIKHRAGVAVALGVFALVPLATGASDALAQCRAGFAGGYVSHVYPIPRYRTHAYHHRSYFHPPAYGYGYGYGYSCAPNAYGPGFSTSFVLTNLPPAGYYYWDPYCQSRYGSLDFYLSHFDDVDHRRVVEVIDVDSGRPVYEYRYSRGRWVEVG